MSTSIYIDKASLTLNKGTQPPLLRESGLWKLFPVIALLAANKFYFVWQPHLAYLCLTKEQTHVGFFTKRTYITFHELSSKSNS